MPTTCLVGKPLGRSGSGGVWADGLPPAGGVAVTAGKAAPAGRRWQTGFGPALVGGPVPARRPRSATGAASSSLTDDQTAHLLETAATRSTIGMGWRGVW